MVPSDTDPEVFTLWDIFWCDGVGRGNPVIFWEPAIVCNPANSPENDQHALSRAIVLLTRIRDSASAGSQMVPGFMLR
jgi:hypothetical protein